MLNKNMAVSMVQVGRKLGTFNFLEKKRKIDFFTSSQIFRFSEGKKVSKKFREHIFLIGVSFSIE